MPMNRSVTLALSLAAIVGATALAQRPGGPEPSPRQAPGQRALNISQQTVRLTLGLGDAGTKPWGGRVSLDEGELIAVEGQRFREGDATVGRDSWKARSLPIRKAVAKKAAAKKVQNSGPGTSGVAITPTIVDVTILAPTTATLRVQTEQGDFQFPLKDLLDGRPKHAMEGRVEAQLTPTAVPLVTDATEDDFPAAVMGSDGSAWVVYVAHAHFGPDASTAFDARPKDFSTLKPGEGGDQLKLIKFADGRPGTPMDVTSAGLDLWRPAITFTDQGLVVVWSERQGGNFDLFSRQYDIEAKSWGDPKRLTTNPGSDTDVVLTATSGGSIMAWQAWREGKAQILLAPVDQGEAAAEVVNDYEGNAWSPAITHDAQGNIFVAYDSYASGNYDVFVRRFNSMGKPDGLPIAVANSPRFEARPSVAVDGAGRVWVAFEERTENWGKDAENLITGAGSTLYRQAAVKVRYIDGKTIREGPDPVSQGPPGLRTHNSHPRLIAESGRLWLAFRHRKESIWGNNSVMVTGAVWQEFVTALGTTTAAPPLPLPSSDNMLDNRPALLAPVRTRMGNQPLLAVYSSDGRLRREVEHSPELTPRYYSHSGTPPGFINNDLFIANLDVAPGSYAVVGTENPGPEAKPGAIEHALSVHPNEPADIARMRAHRVSAGGKTYQFLRGDFHRHTEISQDGGSDGSLEDMWRYAIDAAGFDWMGNADHDNGGGKAYTWWLVQKTTDLYQSPRLTTLFSYERSVSYPHGHRNVMFAERGIRTLPRLVMNGRVVDEDTPMLYDYLKQFGGVCASHTSGTGMGTDWRDFNPTYEPIVEIFQGHRNSYEHFGAPRVARRPAESIGGWQPLGMIWNALAMQYKVGFQASSDHISTHISYAVAVAENPSREAVLDAFRRRHCYGATDNIVLDVKTADGAHMMGDEFNIATETPVSLKVLVHGVKPVARVDIIKDFVYVYSTEPGKDRVEFTWTDTETRGPGLSWYYVRAIQEDGQLAWGSPLWVRSAPR